MTVNEFLERFMKGTLGKKRVEGNWSMVEWGNMEVLRYTPSDCSGHDDVAYKLPSGEILVNATEMRYTGQALAWGNQSSYRTDNNQMRIRRTLEGFGGILFPFNLFTEVGLDVRDFAWVQTPKAEDVTINEKKIDRYTNKVTTIKTQRHFSGACLFKIGNNTYLFDVDRQELDHGIFNPFVTKLTRHSGTVEDAYDNLIPLEVKCAQLAKKDVYRQGEFFFVKVSDECPVQITLTEEEKQTLRYPPSRYGFGISATRDFFSDSDPLNKYPETEIDTPLKQEFQDAAIKYKKAREKKENSTPKSGTLSKTSSASHNVEFYVKDGEITYVSGKISQSRREHHDLLLIGWYKVVPNTAVQSFTIQGRID